MCLNWFEDIQLGSVAARQHEDGLWTTNLIDQTDFPDTETSGSALYCYAMAWGINQGILKRKKYEPAVRAAYLALIKELKPEGYLGRCQVVSH